MRCSRVLLILVPMIFTFAGCVEDGSRPDIIADLACETAAMTIRLRGEMAPAPKSDVCERCSGLGTIGDGAAIKITCPDCKGTGKR